MDVGVQMGSLGVDRRGRCIGSLGAPEVNAVLIALGVAVTGMALIAYEIAGLTVPGWHTISYSGHRSWLVRFGIVGLALAFIGWWLVHSASNIVK